MPKKVQFTTTDEKFDLPDKCLLKLHAACCRVAHMSGAAGYFTLETESDNDPDQAGLQTANSIKLDAETLSTKFYNPPFQLQRESVVL
jgi:hypothetical protein